MTLARRKELADISGSIRHETEKAYLFDDGTRVVWVPKSHCEWDPDSGVMTLPEWLAIEKELV